MGIALNGHLSEGVYSNSLPRISVFFITMFKDIQWYEWIYEVNEEWLIRSIRKNNILKSWDKGLGYMRVDLSIKWKRKAFLVHRIVAITFIPNPENKPQVNHKNWVKSDNQVDNLEWATASENTRHAWDNLFIKNKRIYVKRYKSLWGNNHNARKVLQFTRSWEFIREWDSIMDAKRYTKISQSNISLCCKWIRGNAGWYMWKYWK